MRLRRTRKGLLERSSVDELLEPLVGQKESDLEWSGLLDKRDCLSM